MSVRYGELTIENCNFISEKGKSKKDGVYKARGIAYKVKNNNVRWIATKGIVYEYCYGFMVELGKYNWPNETAIQALVKLKS